MRLSVKTARLYPSESASLAADAMLKSIIEIAKLASIEILDVYRSEFAVRAKEDRSPLTEADLRSHRTIVARLGELTPDIPVLSEESVQLKFADRAHWERFWLVDPLDGTKEFIKRNGEFTVNIALIEKGEPVLGVVGAPDLDRWYAAAKGQGATKQEGELAPVSIRCNRIRPGAPWRVVGSRSHPSPRLGGLLEKLGPHEMVPMGSSLKLCLVADGTADLYPRFGPTMEWDTGAAHAIVSEAGGLVVSAEGEVGRVLSYNKENLLNPQFLCAEVGVTADVLRLGLPQ